MAICCVPYLSGLLHIAEYPSVCTEYLQSRALHYFPESAGRIAVRLLRPAAQRRVIRGLGPAGAFSKAACMLSRS